MLQNIKNSVAIMTEFKDHVTSTGSNSLGIDLSLRVLTTGFWPLRSEDATVILPHAPQKAYDLFKRFFNLVLDCGSDQLNEFVFIDFILENITIGN